ncbi:MAG: GNAT family N-acetyltransferase [Clostridia bacterium]|nr:GNAT family N-acetyltransferase [Clostridia bacterium]
MTIRPMESADLAACADILMSVYNNELWQCRWSKDAAMEYLSDLFQARKFVGYVALQQDEIVGSIFAREKVWWNNSEVFVEEMFVKPECQRMGCGSHLLQQVELYVIQHGLAGITLSTNRYAPAPQFYRKHGFDDCGHVLFMAKEMQKI